jgi:murein tripeptide amidase MpaA
MKQLTLLFAFTILYFSLSFAEAPEKFSRIRIDVPDRTTLQTIWSTGIDYEGVTGKIGGTMEFVAGHFELQQLAIKNIAYQIITDDMAKEASERLAHQSSEAIGFGYGSMGGFYTFQEVLKQLDTMRMVFPNIITMRESIGTTREGRALWMVKISDLPNQNEPNEPQVLYTALHHAREPQGMMALMYYMWWLLQNHGEHPEATYLVNNRAMFFIPVMNADGYVYNQTTTPGGGGMWRKNRRVNGDGTFGVDPNRNYGPEFMWNAPNGGSSTSTSSETYRGTAPFSEPENQAIDNFMRSHNIKACLNYHTYSNLIIYPWGYQSKENPDSLIYRDFAYELSNSNNYTTGTDLQTVGYATRGNSDDYMYGDTSNGKGSTWAMTPEVGSTGFWPSVAEIFPLAIENLNSNKYVALVSGHTTRLREFSMTDEDNDTFLERGEQFTFNVKIRNKGFSKGTNITIGLSADTLIAINSPTVQLQTISALTDSLLQFNGTVKLNAKEGVNFPLVISFSDVNGYSWKDTVQLVIGTPTVLLSDDASNGISNWTASGGWNTTTSKYHTPPASFNESPNGTYPSSANSTLTKTTGMNLTGYDYVTLQYWTYWAIEPSYDFATVEISTNNGSSWSTLRTSIMQKGVGSSQPSTAYGYDGYTPGLTFIFQEINLSNYIGQTVKLRFHTVSDGGEERDGFFVDDIRVLGYHKSIDTGVFVSPALLSVSGIPGRDVTQQIQLFNNTLDTVVVTVAESLLTSAEKYSFHQSVITTGANNIAKKIFTQQISKMQPARFDNKGEGIVTKAWTTVINDPAGDNLFRAVDMKRVDYQKRTIPGFGDILDLRLVMNTPDSNVMGFISIDTDQDFGTGNFPTPFGFGFPTHDVGAEFEIACFLSTEIAESLGVGSIPLAVVVSAETDSIVGLPLPVSIAQDSVITASFSVPLGSFYLNDDGKLNLSTMFYRTKENPIPDIAPEASHGNIGGELGVSWMRTLQTEIVIAPGDTSAIDVRTLTAKNPGVYSAQIKLFVEGQQPKIIPVTMQVTAPPPSHIVVPPAAIRDTVEIGDSAIVLLSVTNTGAGNLYYAVLDTTQAEWLTLENNFGMLEQNGTNEITLRFETENISVGNYSTTLVISSNDPTQRTLTRPVFLNVIPQVGITEQISNLPTKYELEQNYPNPFNPQTVIGFSLLNGSNVVLKVYDMLGREVATVLNNEKKDAGKYTVLFDATNLPSGVYIYRLTANNGKFSDVKKLMLLK